MLGGFGCGLCGSLVMLGGSVWGLGGQELRFGCVWGEWDGCTPG